jgi:hypothetical protein
MPHGQGQYFPMDLQSWGLVYIQTGPKRSGTGVCGVRPRKRLSFLLGVLVTVFQIEMFAVLVCVGDTYSMYSQNW